MIIWTERAKAAIAQKGRDATAKTDETEVSKILAVSAVPSAPTRPNHHRVSSVLSVSPNVELEKSDSDFALFKDSDRWCWPNSSAMNTAEIFTFYLRLEQFFGRPDAEQLADRLVIRDRDREERVMCVECKYLQGLNCRNWVQAGVALKAEGATLPSSFTVLLQRCDGFKPAISFSKL